MDENNISNLKQQAPRGSKAKILLLGDFDPTGDRIIRDPYYVSNYEFDKLKYYQTVYFCTNNLNDT